jgi:hypothetical protein
MLSLSTLHTKLLKMTARLKFVSKQEAMGSLSMSPQVHNTLATGLDLLLECLSLSLPPSPFSLSLPLFLHTYFARCTMCIHTMPNETCTVAKNSITPSVSHQLTFSSNLQNILCVNINIIDNDITTEDLRTFNVVLSTDNELVSVGDSTVVQVIDNDCKC